MDPATIIATYTALAGTDAATLDADTLAYLKSLNSNLYDLQTLTGEDWETAVAIDKTGLLRLRRTLEDLLNMLDLTLKRVR